MPSCPKASNTTFPNPEFHWSDHSPHENDIHYINVVICRAQWKFPKFVGSADAISDEWLKGRHRPLAYFLRRARTKASMGESISSVPSKLRSNPYSRPKQKCKCEVGGTGFSCFEISGKWINLPPWNPQISARTQSVPLYCLTRTCVLDRDTQYRFFMCKKVDKTLGSTDISLERSSALRSI